MRLRLLTILVGLMGIAKAFGAEALYFVGGFNNWDISHPTVVTAGPDGLYETEIDFSDNREFKVSTVNPHSDWNKFDTGTLYPLGEPKENEWVAIAVHPVSGNIKAPVKKVVTVKVDLANMRIMFSTDGITHTPWSGTLPVMHISTEDGVQITSKENYVQATYWLDAMGVEGVESVGSADAPSSMQIRGRGNYTWWGFEKKPYRIKLDKKTPLLGMDSSKHFALLAHADDSAGGLKTVLGFAASETLGLPWTPVTQPLEVVLNGDYIGLYWLTETVRVDKNRVNVIEQTDGAIEDVDGGWLVEIDNYDLEPHVTVMNSSGHPIWFTYKSPEVLSSAQESYLQHAMQSIQNALSSGNESETSRLVDFEILARYFIVNQLMLDMESFHGSCYLYRQRGDEEKWKFGPVWDFGNAFSQGRGDNPRFIFDHSEFTQNWIGEFYAMPGFVEKVKSVWTTYLNGGEERMSSALEQSAEQIAVAAINDAKRWPQYAHSDIEGEASKLQRWMGNSVEWLKKQWGRDAAVGMVPDDGLDVTVKDGILTVRSNNEVDISVYRIDGTSMVFSVKEGENRLSLLPGVYLVGGRKVMVR